MHYDIQLKKKLCEEICLNKASTIKTAEEFNVPLKTLEKWITAYNKNPHCFDFDVPINDFRFINNQNNSNDQDLSIDELKKIIMKKDIEIARLKKGYLVEGDGTGKKVFVTLSKKNMK